MQQLTPVGRKAVSDIAARYNISPEAVEHMLVAVNNGSGTQAQFNCPELGGGGQWMRGGMVMVGDMFNHGLKQTVDNLCNELGNLLANAQIFPELPAGTPGSLHWWPANLGAPSSSGSQNNLRYAVFPQRLVVDIDGRVTVYDTLDHQIGGVSQQQGGGNSLSFTSQYGTVSVSSLPVVSANGDNQIPDTNFATANDSYYSEQYQGDMNTTAPLSDHREPNVGVQTDAAQNTLDQKADNAKASNSDDENNIIALIEKLAQLHSAGVLSDEEFGTKKQELLARL